MSFRIYSLFVCFLLLFQQWPSYICQLLSNRSNIYLPPCVGDPGLFIAMLQVWGHLATVRVQNPLSALSRLKSQTVGAVNTMPAWEETYGQAELELIAINVWLGLVTVEQSSWQIPDSNFI